MATSTKAGFARDTSVVPLNARISAETMAEAKKLAEKSGKSMSDFVRDAMENEVSRLTLCKPKREASLDDVMSKLDTQQEFLTSLSAQNRLHTAQLDAVLQAIGILN